MTEKWTVRRGWLYERKEEREKADALPRQLATSERLSPAATSLGRRVSLW